jgi:cytochrome P450 family 4 subfamily V
MFPDMSVTTGGAVGLGVAIILGIILLLLLLWKFWISRYSHWPNPEALPWIGTTLSFPLDGHAFFNWVKDWTKKHDYLFISWLGPKPLLVTARAEYVEAVLSSKTLITKSFNYMFFWPWLGTGLLTSTGLKWKKRRRQITPSFHFSILNGFATIFEDHSKILVDKLKSFSESGETVEVQEAVSLAKLDVICETSMGVKINAQGAPSSEYATAINSLNTHLIYRMRTPWLWPTFLYKLSATGKEFYKNLDIIQNFTVDVINKNIARRKLEKENAKEGESVEDDGEGNRRKKPKVFLDTLLDLFDAGEIDIEGIQEEVDTFMFEGYDTTTTGLSWTMYELGRKPDVQEKLYAELINADPELGIVERVKSIKYLDYVLKEGLRLHPPVSMFGRIVDTDTVVDGKVIPKGTNVALFAYMLHRNPMYWDDPDTFNPDRFGKEDYFKRNPYVYIPFSAGSRNCVGQKFAMLEEKIMMYYLVLNYRFTSTQKEEDISDCFEIIHKSENGLYMTFESRNLINHSRL